ncbi:uncharacterized protein V6R79_013451 [Siganus canaliculatus]
MASRSDVPPHGQSGTNRVINADEPMAVTVSRSEDEQQEQRLKLCCSSLSIQVLHDETGAGKRGEGKGTGQVSLQTRPQQVHPGPLQNVHHVVP